MLICSETSNKGRFLEESRVLSNVPAWYKDQREAHIFGRTLRLNRKDEGNRTNMECVRIFDTT